jgi:hypothetical protein
MTLESGLSCNLLIDWLRRVRENQYVHYETGAHFSRLSYWLGVPAMILSAAVGTTVFASLAKTEMTAPDASALFLGLSANEWRIVIGLVSAFSAVLTSLQTFLRYPERAASHRRTGADYGALRRALEAILAFPPADPDDLNHKLELIRARMDRLATEAPEVPSILKKKFDSAVPPMKKQDFLSSRWTRAESSSTPTA